MKKIGIIVQNFPVPSETFIVTKVLGLIDNGFDVEIFSVNKSVYWDTFDVLKNRDDVKKRVTASLLQYKDNTIKLIICSLWEIFKKLLLHPVPFYRLVKHVQKKIKDRPLKFADQFLYSLMFVGKKPDVIHIEFDAQGYGRADLKDYLHCKLVLSSRGDIRRTSVLKRYPEFYPYIFSKVDHYHFISKYLHEQALKAGLASHTPISLIEPAIDLSLFKPEKRQKTEGVPIIITIARLSWAKGYEFAIDAVAMAAKKLPDIQYWILGDGPYEETIRYAAYQHGLLQSGIVQFKGQISREDVIEYLQRADIMIHPALEEGFCNAVIEGQAMEIPVVCSDAGGLPENVEDGVTGFVVPRRDARAMAEKILYLAANPVKRQTMGEAGRQRALARYNIQHQIDKFTKLYTTL